MATITTTSLVDDIDGSTDDLVTCAFGLLVVEQEAERTNVARSDRFGE